MLFLLSTLAIAVLPAACRRDATDLREWTPGDHDHTSGPNSGQVAPTGDAGARQAAPNRDPGGIGEVAWVTWRRACVSCHGNLGRGDGIQGPMVKAKDLTDPSWQATVSDERLATSITRGKNAMPAFDLPPATVEGLVKLVRLLGGAARAHGGGAPAPDAGGARGGTDGGATPAQDAP